MSKKDIFGDEVTTNENDFGALLDQSMRGLNRGVKVGDTLKGEILTLGKDECFVSTGTPIDGMIPSVELLDESKQLKYKKGDIIEVVVVKVRDGEIRLRLRGAKGAAEIESLEDAFDMELPVEGKVTEVVKGGFRVSLNGKLAFCPISQMDIKHIQDQSVFVGNKYEFVITKFEEKGRNIVVSRRQLLEIAKAENEGLYLEKHKEGDIVEGQISRMDTFGAFVELTPGVEGLVHISEITWGRLKHASEVLTVGMPVRVKILKITDEEGKLRISLSIKQGGGESDPWLSVVDKFPLGSVHKAVVSKKETFGLFVSLSAGFQGLLPKSKWRDAEDVSVYENKKKGDEITVRIDEIKIEERKISLGLPGQDGDEAWRSFAAPAGAKTGLGTFADLLNSARGKK